MIIKKWINVFVVLGGLFALSLFFGLIIGSPAKQPVAESTPKETASLCDYCDVATGTVYKVENCYVNWCIKLKDDPRQYLVEKKETAVIIVLKYSYAEQQPIDIQYSGSHIRGAIRR